jgi:hypothetical protein
MSGPKHSTYSVRENALRLQREREEAERRARERAEAMARANMSMAELDQAIAIVDQFEPVAATELRRQATEIMRETASHAQVLALPSVIDSLTRSVKAKVQDRREAVERARQIADNSDEIERSRQQTERAKAEAIENWRNRLAPKIEALRLRAKGKLAAALEVLATDVWQENNLINLHETTMLRLEAKLSDQIRSIEQASQLQEALGGFSRKDVGAIRQSLQQVIDGEQVASSALFEQAKQTSIRLKKAEDRRYVAQVLAKGFRELGYKVSEGFETAFATGGSVEIQREGESDYAAQLHVDKDTLALDAELVSLADTSHKTSETARKDDAAAEQAWCLDLARVHASAHAAGISSKLKPKRRIGAAPVRSVYEEREGEKARRRQTIASPRTRELKS